MALDWWHTWIPFGDSSDRGRWAPQGCGEAWKRPPQVPVIANGTGGARRWAPLPPDNAEPIDPQFRRFDPQRSDRGVVGRVQTRGHLWDGRVRRDFHTGLARPGDAHRYHSHRLGADSARDVDSATTAILAAYLSGRSDPGGGGRPLAGDSAGEEACGPTGRNIWRESEWDGGFQPEHIELGSLDGGPGTFGFPLDRPRPAGAIVVDREVRHVPALIDIGMEGNVENFNLS